MSTVTWDNLELDQVEAVQPRAAKTQREHGLTIGGWILLVTGILVFMSGYSEFRPKIGTVALHPYQGPLLLAFPLVFLLRFYRLPWGALGMYLIFVGIYLASTLPSPLGVDFGEWAKILATTASTVTVALLVRSRRDFVWGALGLLIGVATLAIIALMGFSMETGHLQEVLDTGNKNAYSLFALPAIMVAGYVIVRQPETSSFIKVILAVLIFASLLTIFLSANRSGYVCAALIGVILLVQPSGWEYIGWILFGLALAVLQSVGGNLVAMGVAGVAGGLRLMWRPKVLGIFAVLTIGVGVYLFLNSYLSTRTFEYRMQETRDGLRSDSLRIALVVSAAKICLANPVLGVSPQSVPYRLGDYVYANFDLRFIDSHNVFGHIAAASGLLAILSFLTAGILLARWNPYHQPLRFLPQRFRDARGLMQGLLFLYLVRGMFTREILYNPGFAIAIGLALGLLITASTEQLPDISRNDDDFEYDENLSAEPA